MTTSGFDVVAAVIVSTEGAIFMRQGVRFSSCWRLFGTCYFSQVAGGLFLSVQRNEDAIVVVKGL